MWPSETMPRTCTCTNSCLTHRRAFAFQPRGILLFTYERKLLELWENTPILIEWFHWCGSHA